MKTARRGPVQVERCAAHSPPARVTLLMVAALAGAFALIGAVKPAVSASPAAKPDGYVCSFTKGSAWSYANGRFKADDAGDLRFTITGIDITKQVATLGLSDGRTGPLRVVNALNARHYIEVAAEGYLNVTTLYDVDPTRGMHPAVHSRHTGFFGSAIIAQYRGACRARASK
ncbi:MAG: hypothetical protein AAFR04_04510 [Pseudomonadota bacterium]